MARILHGVWHISIPLQAMLQGSAGEWKTAPKPEDDPQEAR
jgi:hypothetical protein